MLRAAKHHALYQKSMLEKLHEKYSDSWRQGTLSISSNDRETCVKICLGYYFAKSAWFSVLPHYQHPLYSTQTEHKQQYFKIRSSLRKCGCLINPKLEEGITPEQLFGKTSQVQAERKEAVWLSHMLYALNSTQKAYSSHS